MKQLAATMNGSPLQGRVIDDQFLNLIGDEILRFARPQLGNDAEDAVQEALAGALKNASSFRGEAALKARIIAILNSKIADVLRRRQKHGTSAMQFESDDDIDSYPADFSHRGVWHDASRPPPWDEPEAALHSNQFLAIFDTFLLSQRLEREHALSERTNLRLHVTMCRGSTNFEQQPPEIGKAVRAFASFPV